MSVTAGGGRGFARGDGVSEIARDLRVTPGSVRRWRRAWQDGGTAALRSKGPVSRERMSPLQWARLGPLAHGFDCRDLIIATHRRLTAPLVWCWDNLNLHLAPQLAEFAAENKEWLRIYYRMAACASELNPAEGVWSLLKRAIANFAAPDLDRLIRIVKRKLKKIQYRPT